MTTPDIARMSGRDRLAQLLSHVFHPFLVAVATLALVIYLDGATLLDAIKWTAVSFGIVIFPLTLYLIFNVRRGHYSDWSISIREQRHTIYLITAVCFIILVMVFIWAGAPPIALACLYAALPTTILAGAVNRLVTKVSLHSIAMAGCAAALFWVSPPLGLFMAAAALVVGWARVQLKRHTIPQILLGWGIAAGSVMVLFNLYL